MMFLGTFNLCFIYYEGYTADSLIPKAWLLIEYIVSNVRGIIFVITENDLFSNTARES